MRILIVNLLFTFVFVVIGILNVALVHPVPGVFYLLVSLIYLPQTESLLSKKFGLRIPFVAKIILGFVILWGTLAVGDLAEILGL
jgi:hypothetical protein